jgi:hypothetical protein
MRHVVIDRVMTSHMFRSISHKGTFHVLNAKPSMTNFPVGKKQVTINIYEEND